MRCSFCQSEIGAYGITSGGTLICHKCNESDKDAINPSHYTSGGIETIDYLQAKLTGSEYEGFLRGNVLKYVSRYSLKNGLEDLKKAEWYLKRLIEVKSSDTLKKTDS